MAYEQYVSALVVDDQKTSIAVTSAALSALGFKHVEGVCTSAEALKRISEKRFDVIICDWHMAPTDGPQLFEAVKQLAGRNLPRFYFLTGDSTWGCMATARQLGADGFIIKPLRPGEIVSRLSQAFRVSGRAAA